MIRELSGTIDDFCDYQITTPRFLLDGIIPFYGVGLIFGNPGHGKTQLSLTLARDIINGDKFLDEYQCAVGRVAYCSFDLPIHEVQVRLERFREQLANPDNLYAYASDAPKDFYEMAGKSKIEPWVEGIVEFEPDLIIFDTLRKCHFLDENSNSVPGVVYACAKRLFGTASTLLFVHHETKSHEDTRGRPPEQAAAGAYAWTGNSDFGIRAVKYKKRQEVVVSIPRQRFREDVEPLICQFNPKSLLIERKPEQKKGPTVVKEMPKPSIRAKIEPKLDSDAGGY